MFKQWWSIIRLTLINRTATSHLKWFNTNNGYDMRRWRQYIAWTCTTSGGAFLFYRVGLFTSVFSLEIQLSKWNATIPLNSQTPPLVVHVQARYCLQRLMSYPLFVLNHLRWEVAVLFINVNRIIDHHCCDMLFAIIRTLLGKLEWSCRLKWWAIKIVYRTSR
jgi:hypothetical protein